MRRTTSFLATDRRRLRYTRPEQQRDRDAADRSEGQRLRCRARPSDSNSNGRTRVCKSAPFHWQHAGIGITPRSTHGRSCLSWVPLRPSRIGGLRKRVAQMRWIAGVMIAAVFDLRHLPKVAITGPRIGLIFRDGCRLHLAGLGSSRIRRSRHFWRTQRTTPSFSRQRRSSREVDSNTLSRTWELLGPHFRFQGRKSLTRSTEDLLRRRTVGRRPNRSGEIR